MMFSRSFLLALVSAPFLAFAQDSGKPNPFTNTNFSGLTAGGSFTFTWTPTSSISEVTLRLRQGSSNNLDTVSTIVSNYQNSGSYTWQIPEDIVNGGTYAVEIVDAAHPNDEDTSNYTQQFPITSTNLVSSSASGSSTMPMTTSMSRSTASSGETPSAFPLQSGITLNTTYNDHPSATESSSMTGSSSTMTGTESSMTGTHSSGMTSSTRAPTSSSQQAGLMASSTSTGGVARATAMVGMLGAVALGALAL